MKIYENLTLLTNDLDKVLEFSRDYKNKKINILYPFQSILWQGPSLVKTIEEKLKKKNLFFIAEANTNIGVALSLLRLNLEYLSISKKMDHELQNKLISIAKKKNIEILISEKFCNFIRIEN